jgi:hypothetical protein
MLHLFNYHHHHNVVKVILKIERMNRSNIDDNNGIDMTSIITYISDN